DTLAGDLVILTYGKPESDADLKRFRWTFGFVEKVIEGEKVTDTYPYETANVVPLIASESD
ncbi:hypothetical protein Tco_1374824, partial [Tanacetum coccineum]